MIAHDRHVGPGKWMEDGLPGVLWVGSVQAWRSRCWAVWGGGERQSCPARSARSVSGRFQGPHLGARGPNSQASIGREASFSENLLRDFTAPLSLDLSSLSAVPTLHSGTRC